MRLVPRTRALSAALALASATLVVAVLLVAGTGEALAALPAALLALAVVFRRLPCEELILRLAERPAPRPAHPISSPSPRPPARAGKALRLLVGVRPLRGPPPLSPATA